MELSRLPTSLAAPATCLFYILTVCVFAAQKPTATGVWMPVVRLRPNRVQYSCDGRFVFIQLLADGKTKINGAETPQNDLKPRIGATMESRAERVVYLVPDDAISYDSFVGTLEQLNNAATNMHVAVLSGKLRNEYFSKGLEPCDLIWPN